MAQDPFKYFRIEARELVEGLGQGLLALEKGQGGAEPAARLLRLAHTLKGAARVVRHPRLAELAHRFEELYLPYRGGEEALPRDRVDELFRVADAMAEALRALDGVEAPETLAPARVLAVEEPFETIRVPVQEIDALLEGMNEAGVGLEGLRTGMSALGEAQSALRGLGGLLTEAPEGGRFRSLHARLKAGLEGAQRELRRSADRAERELGLALDTARQMRLVTAGSIFPVLERAARDAGRSLEKEVRFEAAGGEHRVDAHVLAGLREALLHLVRNAVAHGLEARPDRMGAGKTPVGTVGIEVERRGHRLAFICRDDGRGFDLEAIRRVALRRRLVSASEAQGLDLERATRLLLRGGLSTAGRVDEISGRGIGLEAVGAMAARLKGEVRAGGTVGKGAWVELCVPISLATVSALLVESGGQVASLPLDAVRAALRVPAGALSRSGGGLVAHGDRMLPFLPLSVLLGRTTHRQPDAEACSAVVLESESAVVALGVDRVLGTAEVMMKPLPALAGPAPCVAGASFDAEGHPRWVLDPGGLVAALLARRDELPESPPPQPARLLVVDDSLTTRMLEQSILESAGYEVDTAVSAAEGLRKARESLYRLMLVDVEMPGMDGFEFLGQVGTDARLRDVPCILVTSRDSPEDKRRGMEAGARAYIVKSEFDEASFLSRIQELLR